MLTRAFQTCIGELYTTRTEDLVDARDREGISSLWSGYGSDSTSIPESVLAFVPVVSALDIWASRTGNG